MPGPNKTVETSLSSTVAGRVDVSFVGIFVEAYLSPGGLAIPAADSMIEYGLQSGPPDWVVCGGATCVGSGWANYTGGVTTTTITGLTSGQTYCFRAKTRNHALHSETELSKQGGGVGQSCCILVK
jgi:hypothetical protein